MSWPYSGEVWQFELEGGGVLARPDFRGLFLLNPTALEVWRQLRNGASAEGVARNLVTTFDIPFEEALKDVNLARETWQQALLAANPPQTAPLPLFAPSSDHAFTIDCRLHGTTFRILLSSSDLAEEIAPRLESLRVTFSDPPDITFHLVHTERFVYIFRGDELVSTQEDAADARVVLLQEIVRLSTKKQDFLAVLHAGACGSESRCVIFPAATHSGKTTLAAALMGDGLTLYADDSVALDRETLGVPIMPFPLMVREGSWAVVAPRFPGFEQLPISTRYGQNVKFLRPSGEVRNGYASGCAVVFSHWEPGVPLRTSSLTTFEALLRLQHCGFWLAHDRDTIKKFLDWLQQLPIFEMVYSDIGDAARFVRELLQR